MLTGIMFMFYLNLKIMINYTCIYQHTINDLRVKDIFLNRTPLVTEKLLTGTIPFTLRQLNDNCQ